MVIKLLSNVGSTLLHWFLIPLAGTIAAHLALRAILPPRLFEAILALTGKLAYPEHALLTMTTAAPPVLQTDHRSGGGRTGATNLDFAVFLTGTE